jgi:CRP-like cAMP-binding protein
LRGTDSVVADKSKPKFDPEAFLAKVEGGVSIAKYGKGQVIFAQGDAVDSVFYIREGRVKISVVSAQARKRSSRSSRPEISSARVVVLPDEHGALRPPGPWKIP